MITLPFGLRSRRARDAASEDVEGASKLNCDYCGSAIESGAEKCANCGAPVTAEAEALPDYRSCPFCSRKLLALGSPACSYCGRRLPNDYIRARESDLRRLEEIRGTPEASDPGSKIGEFFRKSAHPRGGSSSVLGGALELLDPTSLFDIFS